MASRQQREAKLALKAARQMKQKRRAKKQAARLAALANPAPEIPPVVSAAPARDEPEYDVWHSEAEGQAAQSDSSSSAAFPDVGDDVNYPVGDDVNHPVGDDVNHPVGDDVNHPVSDDTRCTATTNEDRPHVSPPRSPSVLVSSDHDSDGAKDEVGDRDDPNSAADVVPYSMAVPGVSAPSSPPSSPSMLLLNKATLNPQQQQQQQPNSPQSEELTAKARGQKRGGTGLTRPTSLPKQPLLTLQQQLEALAKKQQLALQQQLKLQQLRQQQLNTSEADSLETARAQIKQLEARLAVEGHILEGHLQRERLEAAEKEARQGEQRMPASLILLANPDYASRFENLVKSGWSMPDAHSALQITALDNNFSVQRAHAHLLALQAKETSLVLERAADGLAEAGQAPIRILETSALARVLAEIPDAVDIVVKLKAYHARAKVRATHNALPALCAANLVQVATVQNDQANKRFGYAYLCRVAAAVSEDCTECKALRDKRTQQEAWKAAAAQAAAAKQEKATAAKIAREKNANSTREQDGFLLDLPFKLSDSRRATNKPHGVCETCHHGYIIGVPDTTWLVFCDHCDKGYHVYCVTWTLFRKRDGSEHVACRSCMDANELAYANGDTPDEWKVLLTNTKGKAPHHAAASTTSAKPQTESHHSLLSEVSRVSATPPRTPTKPHQQGASSAHGGGSAADSMRASRILDRDSLGFFEPNPSSILLGSGKKTPNVKVKDYTTWEAVPDDWVKKKDAKSDEHPEKGYGKEAYKNWRRKNVTLRDAAMEDTSYGLLARALSDEIKVSIGTQFLASESTMPGIWEREAFSNLKAKDRWVDAWVETHHDFAWVNQVDDETMLRVLDKHFGVKSTSVFLARRFPSNLPLTNEKGEVNYYETEFNRWATNWQTELIELQKSGCDFSGTDLYQAFLNALSTNKTIWNEASQNASRSPYVLIAYLRDWLRKKSLSAQETRDERDALLSQQNPKPQERVTPNGQKTTPTNAGHDDPTTRAIALFTQTMSAYAQQMASGPASQSHDEAKTSKPLPPHIKACKDTAKCKCQGCGNVWARNRPIPCFYKCKYIEHPLYNTACERGDYGSKDSLTWKDFTSKYPGTAIPPTCVEWEKNNEAFLAKKRSGREEPANASKR
jgi:hypothetical protein